MSHALLLFLHPAGKRGAGLFLPACCSAFTGQPSSGRSGCKPFFHGCAGLLAAARGLHHTVKLHQQLWLAWMAGGAGVQAPAGEVGVRVAQQGMLRLGEVCRWGAVRVDTHRP